MNTASKILLTLVVTAASAFAGSVTSDMSVSATVSADCRIDSVGAMSFGTMGIPFAIANTNSTGTASVGYTCVNTGVAPKIRLGQGLHPAEGSTNAAPLRRLSDGTNFISYGLYSDESHSTPWENSNGVAGAADGTAKTVTVYGVATAANVPAGTYTDTVVVSVDF